MFGNPTFVSAKCVSAIPLSGAVPVDALVRVTLDPAVTSIEYCESIDLHGFELPIDAVVITRADGRYFLNVVDDRTILDLDAVGTTLLALDQHGISNIDITLAELRAEPARGDRRRIWACRGIPVSDDIVRKIASALRAHGESTLGALADHIATPIAIETIFALVCRNLVTLDFSAPLSLDTIVRVVRAPLNKDSTIPLTGGPI